MSVTKKLLAIAAMSASLSGGAFAQTNAAPSAGGIASAETKVAITEMLEAINFRQTMIQISATMTQSMPQMFEQTSSRMFEKLPPAEQKAAKEKFAASAQGAMEKAMAIYRDPEILKGVEDIMGRAYTKRFTLAEIKSITAFYKSDAGKKMLSAGPQLMQEAMPEIVALTAPKTNALMQEFTKKALEDAKAASEAKTVTAK
ncbi:MAG: DUF2059 domain-containing protein [Rhodocyclaceae bacterium]|nr:DUF2059 domain-containing protein [Rhodocyclaceae bacterium]